MDNLKRCPWGDGDALYREYHDNVWGVPNHDEKELFRMLILEGMQAGLSWSLILKKMPHFDAAFDNFDVEKIVCYDEHKVYQLLQNEKIIRNRLKINSVITNAKAYLNLKNEFSGLDEYFWRFVDGKPIVNNLDKIEDMPAKTPLSDAISRDLKKRGFKFVGSTIVYSFMQATGMVNDHLTWCDFRRV